MRLIKTSILLIAIFYNSQAWSLPDSVEMWFLSENKFTKILEIINEKYAKSEIYSPLVEKSDSLFDCVPMGDGCFHPQTGFKVKSPSLLKKEKKRDVAPKTFNAIETNLIECDENNYFDMYCGKEKKERRRSSKSQLEIWIDTSSSFRIIDYTKEGDHCQRRVFIQKVFNQCERKGVDVSVFDISIKEMGGMDSLCVSYGTNDQDRLIEWIKRAKAKKLIIITDIAECSTKLKEFLDSIGARTEGIGVQPFFAKDLSGMVSKLTGYCK